VVLSYKEWRALLAAARESGSRDAALISLMYEAGLRAGEVGLLQLENCTRLSSHRVVYIHRLKGGRSAWCDVSEATQKALLVWIRAAYPSRRTKDLPLFPGLDVYKGRVQSALSRWAVARAVRRLCRDANVVREMAWPHALRHTRVMHIVDSGFKKGLPIEQLLPAVAKIVGHKSAWTTITNYISETRGVKRAVQELTTELMKDDPQG
jgi:integrase